MSTFFKDLFFSLTSRLGLPQDRAVILMYHSVSDWKHFTTVSPQNFERQMAYIVAKKIPVISLLELVRRLKAKEPLGGAIAITFDDGYRDNFTAAYPILKKYNFPATVFIETDLIGESYDDVPHMTTGEMQQMSDLIEFGAHTKSHPKLAELSAAEAREEIVGSKKILEEILHTPCTLFACPFGNYNQETLSLLRDARFEAAVTVKEGTVGLASDPLELPRVSIDSSTTFAQFKGKLSTAIDVYQSLKIWK